MIPWGEPIQTYVKVYEMKLHFKFGIKKPYDLRQEDINGFSKAFNLITKILTDIINS